MNPKDYTSPSRQYSRSVEIAEWHSQEGEQHFGALLTTYRKDAKLAVKDLAKLTKLSTLAVVKIENGTRLPTPKSVDALIRALNLSEGQASILKGCSKANLQFGSVIKQAREVCGLSMRDIAYNVGMSHSALQKIESGLIHPTISTVIRIADALQLDNASWERFLAFFLKRQPEGPILASVVLEIIRQAGIDSFIEKNDGDTYINVKLGSKVRVTLKVC